MLKVFWNIFSKTYVFVRTKKRFAENWAQKICLVGLNTDSFKILTKNESSELVRIENILKTQYFLERVDSPKTSNEKLVR